jgi:hypothetical protein
MPMVIPNPNGGPAIKTILPVPRAMLQPTVPISKYDFDQFEFQTIKDWLSEPDGIAARKQNPLGVLNLELHGDLHEAAMKAKMPPPMPVPPKLLGKPGAPQLPPPGATQPGAGPMNAPIQ